MGDAAGGQPDGLRGMTHQRWSATAGNASTSAADDPSAVSGSATARLYDDDAFGERVDGWIAAVSVLFDPKPQREHPHRDCSAVSWRGGQALPRPLPGPRGVKRSAKSLFSQEGDRSPFTGAVRSSVQVGRYEILLVTIVALGRTCHNVSSPGHREI